MFLWENFICISSNCNSNMKKKRAVLLIAAEKCSRYADSILGTQPVYWENNGVLCVDVYS